MEFLINLFKRILNDYEYKFTCEFDSSVYVFHLIELPPELEMKLIKANYTEFDDKDKVVKHMVCIPSSNEHNERYVSVVLNKEDYARKINIIDGIIKEYRRYEHTCPVSN